MTTPRTPEDYTRIADCLYLGGTEAEQALREAATIRAELDGLRESVGDVDAAMFNAVRIGSDDSISYEPCNVVPADIARRLAVRNAELWARLERVTKERDGLASGKLFSHY